MRFRRTGLCAAAAVALLAGCSGNNASPIATSPFDAGTVAWHGGPVGALVRHWDGKLHGVQAPASAMKGLYVSQYSATNILGYSAKNKKNHKPNCTVPWVSSETNDISVDGTGALLDPDGASASIIIGTGPAMCGAESHTISETYGLPTDATSYNAATGTIVVGNFRDNPNLSEPGSVTLCTAAAGCTTNLTNPAMLGVVGVALDKNGNCWASAESKSAGGILVYFAGCSGSGVVATGFQNTSFGGLDLDPSGNFVSIDETANGVGQIWVYKGCNPACTLVGGPFPMNGESVYGHLNAKGNRLAIANGAYGQIDIYSYSPTSIKYLYSFERGLRASYEVDGAAYDPSM